MGGDGVEMGYQVPFVSTFLLQFQFLYCVLSLPSRPRELEGGIAYGDVELAPSPGFSCHLSIDFLGFKVLSTIVGLVVSLRVYASDSFLNGIASFCPLHCSEVRLDDLHRPQG